MGGIIGFILDRLFPTKCVSCGEITGKYKGSTVLCPKCREKWEVAKRRRCRVCGMAVSDCLCGEGEMYLSGIRDHLKLVFYDGGGGTAAGLIYSLKRGGNKSVIRFLSEECALRLTEYLSARGIDPGSVTLTYPPRTEAERRKNGIDQSGVMARQISEILGCEFISALVRCGGVKQRELDYDERKINAENSIFGIEGVSLDGKIMILIDDVVTSGATMSRGAVLLYRMGAEEVVSLSLSKAGRYIRDGIGIDTREKT
ncbi:MAG: hypothetical protein IKV54_02825 [Clostridia bacterium]|nr:hypothetical protein [Clostridia bacterium]